MAVVSLATMVLETRTKPALMVELLMSRVEIKMLPKKLNWLVNRKLFGNTDQ